MPQKSITAIEDKAAIRYCAFGAYFHIIPNTIIIKSNHKDIPIIPPSQR